MSPIAVIFVSRKSCLSELNDKIQKLYMGMNPKMMSSKRMGEVITCSLVDYKDIPVVALLDEGQKIYSEWR